MAVQVNVVGRWDGKDIDRATRQLQKLGKEAGQSGRTGATGVSKLSTELKGLIVVGGVVGAGIWFKNAIQGAGELQDTVSAAGQVFGQQQQKIMDFGKSAATSMGLSQNAAIKAATSFAVFGKAAGLTGDSAASFSTTLTQLAGDMASFYGGSVEDAVTAIGSALRGEQEPIRRYNVLLDDATLRQEALAMGLIKTTKDALTPQQKVLAANAAILKQTTVVQGDYNRTADQFSNVQRTLQAELENTTTSLATGLLPTATSALQTTRGLVDGFNQIPTPVKVAAAAMAAGAISARLLSTELEKVNGVGRAAPGFFKSLGDTWRYVGTQAAYAGVRYETTGQKLKAFSAQLRATGAAQNVLKGAGSGLLSMLGGPWGIALGGATLAVTAYMNAQQNAQQAVDALTGALDKQSGAMTAQGLQQIADALTQDVNLDDWQRVPVTLEDVTKAVATGGPALDQLRSKLQAYADEMGRTSGDEAARAQQAALGVISSMQNQTEVVYDAKRSWEAANAATRAATASQSAVTPILDRATAAANLQKQGIDQLASAFKNLQGLLDKRAALRNYRDSLDEMGKAIKTAKGHFSDTTAKGREFQAWIDGTIGNLATYAQSFKDPQKQQQVMADGIAALREKLSKAGLKPAEVNRILKPFDRMVARAKTAGEDIASGLALGIATNRADAIAEAQKLGAAAVQAVRRGAEVSSPSKYTRWVGNEVVNGLTQGVIQKAGGAKKLIRDATAEALSGAQGALERFRQRGQDVMSFIDGIRSQVTSFGSVVGFEPGANATTWGMGSGASDVTGQMRAKVEQAKAFAKDIEALRKMGLNNASLQEIIGAGPAAGDQIARALLAGGKSAVSEVNGLEAQLNAAAASIGDTGGLSQYGLTGGQARGLATTTVKVEKGAVVVTVGAGTSGKDARAIEDAVDRALDKAVKRIIREIES